MSYQITVEVKDGVPVVASYTPGQVPEGRFTLSGHEDGSWLSIGVTRYDDGNSQVAQASSYAKRTPQ